jgi:hypothetical protein
MPLLTIGGQDFTLDEDQAGFLTQQVQSIHQHGAGRITFTDEQDGSGVEILLTKDTPVIIRR